MLKIFAAGLVVTKLRDLTTEINNFAFHTITVPKKKSLKHPMHMNDEEAFIYLKIVRLSSVAPLDYGRSHPSATQRSTGLPQTFTGRPHKQQPIVQCRLRMERTDRHDTGKA